MGGQRLRDVRHNVEGEQREGKNGDDLLMARRLILARLNGATGGAVAVIGDTGRGLSFGRAAEKREARD
jgi:hypothetical protein